MYKGKENKSSLPDYSRLQFKSISGLRKVGGGSIIYYTLRIIAQQASIHLIRIFALSIHLTTQVLSMLCVSCFECVHMSFMCDCCVSTRMKYPNGTKNCCYLQSMWLCPPYSGTDSPPRTLITLYLHFSIRLRKHAATMGNPLTAPRLLIWVRC